MIDEGSIYSNDIYAILCTYGVEAARAAILREVGGVFDVYKIDVNSRHLELIADYMVSELPLGLGFIDPANRRSMEATSRSTAQASRQTLRRSSRRPTRPRRLSCLTPHSTVTLTT